MSTETPASRVRNLMAALLQVPVESLKDEASSKSLPAWDSLAHLNLMIELEQEFGISLAPESAEAMTTVASVIRVVEAGLG
jgi:acyl carrier protein